MMLGKLHSHIQKNEVPYLIPYTKITSKPFKSLNIRPETITLLEENIGEKFLYHSDLGNDFLDMKTKAQKTKVKIAKWDYILSWKAMY